jgi:cardiolipin synthase
MTPDGKPKGKIRVEVEKRLRPLTLPNFITLTRMAIVPFFVIAVSEGDFGLALGVLVIAGLTDALDGWMARRFEMESVVGAYLDPIADKLLLVTAYVTLTIPMGQVVVIPLWLAILALFRDFFIMVVVLVLYLVEDIRSFPPSVLGKATTFMHIVTIGVVLLANLTTLPSWAPETCFYLSLALVILSGINYIYRSSRFIEAARAERAGKSSEG